MKVIIVPCKFGTDFFHYRNEKQIKAKANFEYEWIHLHALKLEPILNYLHTLNYLNDLHTLNLELIFFH